MEVKIYNTFGHATKCKFHPLPFSVLILLAVKVTLCSQLAIWVSAWLKVALKPVKS